MMKRQNLSSEDIINDSYKHNKNQLIIKIKDKYIENKDVTITCGELYRLLQDFLEDSEERKRQIKECSQKINIQIKEKFSPYYTGEKDFNMMRIYEYIEELENFGLLSSEKEGRFEFIIDFLSDYSFDFILGQILSFVFIVNNDKKYSKSFLFNMNDKIYAFFSALASKMTREEIYIVLNEFNRFEYELIKYVFAVTTIEDFKKEKLVAKVNRETFTKFQTLTKLIVDENELDLDRDKVKIGSLVFIKSGNLLTKSLCYLVINIDSSAEKNKYHLKV